MGRDAAIFWAGLDDGRREALANELVELRAALAAQASDLRSALAMLDAAGKLLLPHLGEGEDELTSLRDVIEPRVGALDTQIAMAERIARRLTGRDIDALLDWLIGRAEEAGEWGDR